MLVTPAKSARMDRRGASCHVRASSVCFHSDSSRVILRVPDRFLMDTDSDTGRPHQP